jgi:hypothetical protein
MCRIKVGSAASVKAVCQASLKAEQEYQTAVCSVSEGCAALVEAEAVWRPLCSSISSSSTCRYGRLCKICVELWEAVQIIGNP